MIYLIGGAPRVGKTQAVIEVLKQHPMNAIASDEVRYMLRRTLPRTRLQQALQKSHETHPLERTVEELLQAQNAESRALWPSLIHIMEAYNQDGQDLLLEGVAVLPELAVQLPFPTKAVVLSNQAPTHAEAVLRRARAHPHDWLHDKSETEIAHYCQYFTYLDQYLCREAAKYGLPCLPVTDLAFKADLRRAAAELLA
jgi:2-phosphoglycerate kinase